MRWRILSLGLMAACGLLALSRSRRVVVPLQPLASPSASGSTTTLAEDMAVGDGRVGRTSTRDDGLPDPGRYEEDDREYPGQILVHDPAERVIADGTGHLVLQVGLNERPFVVAFDGGTWKVAGRAGDVLTVRSVYLGDRFVTPRQSELCLQGELLLEADLQSSGQLRVVDARSGVELDDVRVSRARDSGSGGCSYPPDPALVVEVFDSARSPLNMPHLPGNHVYWIGSEGYAWERLSFSGEGEMRTVRLRQGGGVEFRFEGMQAERGPHHLRVSLAVTEHCTAVRRLPADGLLSFEGMAPGDYEATVECLRQPTVDIDAETGAALKTLAFRVSSGSNALVRVDLGATYQDLASLQVVVHSGRPFDAVDVGPDPVRRDGGRIRVPFEHFEELTPGTYAALVSPLAPGTYRSTVAPHAAEAWSSVAPGEAAFVQIDLPDLAPIQVVPVSADDRAGVVAERVAFRRPGQGETWRSAVPDGFGKGRRWRLEAPPGQLELYVRAGGFRESVTSHVVSRSGGEIRIELDPVTHAEVEIRFLEDGAEVPVGSDYWTTVGVRPVSGDGRCVRIQPDSADRSPGTSLDSARAFLRMDAPGTYELTFPPVRGFLPIPARRVEATVDGSGLVVVDLVRG